ncbi:flagellin [Peribacillus asahii]|uniref:flagellin N-terminal helical domain-containing protein n=1 Tax=Peribacillus asahii TaxID=228899 RepID=UPI0037F2B2DE
MKINHNITALNAYRNLSVNNSTTAKSLEKLSSGLRINRASDDAAGLAISEKMRSQIRGLDMAERNALDGVSFIQTAEGALSSTHEILQRMRELAIQAGNDSNTDVDRKAIQEEINQLTNEVNRISNTTEFNTKKLLDGSLSNEITTKMAGAQSVPSIEPGQVTAEGLTFSFTGAGATLNGYTVEFGTIADGTSETASIDTANKKIIINGDFDNTDGAGDYSSRENIKAAIEAVFKAQGGSFAGINATVSGNSRAVITGSEPIGGSDTIPAVQPVPVTAGDGLTFKFTGADGKLNGYKIKLVNAGNDAPTLASIDQTSKEITINGDFDSADTNYASIIDIQNEVNDELSANFPGIAVTVEGAASTDTTGSEAIGGSNAIPAVQPSQVTAEGLTFDFAGADGTLNGYTIEFGIVADGTPVSASIDTNKIIINGDFDNTDGTGTYSSATDIKAAIESAFTEQGGSFTGITATVGGTPSAVITGSSKINGGVDGVPAIEGVYQFQVNPQDIIIDSVTFNYDETGSAGWKDMTDLKDKINANTILNAKYEASVIDGKIELKQKTGQESATAPVVNNGNNLVTLQIGANQGQTVSLEVKNMQAETLGISDTIKGGEQKVTLSNGQEVTVWYTKDKLSNNGSTDTPTEYTLDISSNEKAGAAITVLDDAIQRVSSERSRMGAVQNRLEYAVSNLKYMSENVTASESRIRDLDMALEMSTYTKNNILVQSAQAMLAQANQMPQGVLQLLK